MPGGHDTTVEVSNIMSFVLYTQILKQSVLKPASPGITLNSIDCTSGYKATVGTWKEISYLKPRSHALIYTRGVYYTYMYNLHPRVFLGM